MSENLIETQELGKPLKPHIPKSIQTIVERMHQLRAERRERMKKEEQKQFRENFNALDLLESIE